MALRAVVFGLLGSCLAAAVADEPDALHTLLVDGVERQWRIYVPGSYRDDSPAALIFEFHGTGATPESQVELSGLAALAEEQGFLVVTPVAKYPRAQDGRLTWNVDLHEDAVDDVGFVDALIDRVSERFAVDPARVYATGFSGGARMSSRLACDLSDRIAAIGPVGGVRFPEDCAPSRPVPVIAFHGRKDRINPYAHQPDSPDYWRMGVEEAIAGWVGNNGCDAQPTEQTVADDEVRLAWPDCRDSADVVFYRSDTADHTWPGTPIAERFHGWLGPDSVSDTPASALIWQFFAAHPIPGQG